MISEQLKIRIGIVLVILSVIAFVMIPVVPFLDFEKQTKYIISTALFVFAEITFWTGGILLGKQLFNRYKSYLNPKNWKNVKTDKKDQL
jgi:predicted Kef-type K+ transport protein